MSVCESQCYIETHFCFSLAFRKDAKMSRHSLFPMRLLFLFRVRLVLCLPDTKITQKMLKFLQSGLLSKSAPKYFLLKKKITPQFLLLLLFYGCIHQKSEETSAVPMNLRLKVPDVLYLWNCCIFTQNVIF